MGLWLGWSLAAVQRFQFPIETASRLSAYAPENAAGAVSTSNHRKIAEYHLALEGVRGGWEGRQPKKKMSQKKKSRPLRLPLGDCARTQDSRLRYLLGAPPTTQPQPPKFYFPPFFSTLPLPSIPPSRTTFHPHPAIL
ncbi:hypothetical protein M441DRAFT_253072 [Trichoderma asperellum CBS 433.97]|uniref:Uncharacterized protein n=1 Tax=Trichoderma asperellum (strain ATCC 204424 / CBS 433.97 / NBRC 101777) TaxID=1042311 RepID=A0A2T3YY62_TRIA4|nr:hypothetical protein M441DRAFT_253072 [Trichoderma asperellum CBS 433.97]PTB37505.1 hypothetical protein M441DRAFT_253072 [Trichoderma asperellum CBS 433.97]